MVGEAHPRLKAERRAKGGMKQSGRHQRAISAPFDCVHYSTNIYVCQVICLKVESEVLGGQRVKCEKKFWKSE